MGSKPIRISLDLPRDLHRNLHIMAARNGCSARQLILLSIENAVAEGVSQKRKRRLKLDRPIVPSTGKPFALTNKQIYDFVDLA